jgi:glycosyltransferase involved in cell wall biosynthesis
MKKINILYIDNTFTFGGAINSLFNLFKALNKEKYCPILITGQPDEFMASHFKGFIYYRFNFKLSWIHNKLYKRIISLRICQNKILLKIINAVRFIYRLICITLPESFRYYRIGKRHDVKIVHLNNILGSQLAGILSAKLLKVPCVAHLRDFEEVDFITRFYARMIEHHIAISFAIKENLLQLRVPEDKISVVHDAIDLETFNENVSFEYLVDEFRIKKGKKLFGIFGRIIEWKGIKEFVRAVERVIGEVPKAKAFVVGSPSDGTQDYYDEVVDLVDRLGLNKKVIFTGYRTDIPAIMKLMNVVIHSSIRPEPFGMILIEAMAMGKPVVATKAGGPLDIVVHGKTGFLVSPRNSEEMSKAIIRLLQDPSLCHKMGNNGEIRVRNSFCKERYSSQVTHIYNNICQTP